MDFDEETKTELASIKISHIVSAAKFWVSETKCEETSEQKLSLELLEGELSALLRNSFQIPSNLPENTLLAVKNEKLKSWHRGELVSPYPTNSICKLRVFLVDHGILLSNVQPKHLQILPHRMHQLPYQAVLVCLYGLLPISVTVHLENIHDKMHFEECSAWTQASERLVRLLLDVATNTLLRPILIKGNLVYGEIYVNIPHLGYISLHEVLIKFHFAKYSEESYKKVMENEARLKRIDKCVVKPLPNELSDEEGDYITQDERYVLMKDFLAECGDKELENREKVIRALKSIENLADVTHITKDDDERSESESISSASRTFGRGFNLRLLGNTTCDNPVGRNSPSVFKENDLDELREKDSPETRKSSGSRLVDLLNARCKKVEEPVNLPQNIALKEKPVLTVPAGHPVSFESLGCNLPKNNKDKSRSTPKEDFHIMSKNSEECKSFDRGSSLRKQNLSKFPFHYFHSVQNRETDSDDLQKEQVIKNDEAAVSCPYDHGIASKQSHERIHNQDKETEIHERPTGFGSQLNDGAGTSSSFHRNILKLVRNCKKSSSKNNSVESKHEKKEQQEQSTCTTPKANQTCQSGLFPIHKVQSLIRPDNESCVVGEVENKDLRPPSQKDLEGSTPGESVQKKTPIQLESLLNLVKKTRNLGHKDMVKTGECPKKHDALKLSGMVVTEERSEDICYKEDNKIIANRRDSSNVCDLLSGSGIKEERKILRNESLLALMKKKKNLFHIDDMDKTKECPEKLDSHKLSETVPIEERPEDICYKEDNIIITSRKDSSDVCDFISGCGEEEERIVLGNESSSLPKEEKNSGSLDKDNVEENVLSSNLEKRESNFDIKPGDTNESKQSKELSVDDTAGRVESALQVITETIKTELGDGKISELLERLSEELRTKLSKKSMNKSSNAMNGQPLANKIENESSTSALGLSAIAKATKKEEVVKDRESNGVLNDVSCVRSGEFIENSSVSNRTEEADISESSEVFDKLCETSVNREICDKTDNMEKPIRKELCSTKELSNSFVGQRTSDTVTHSSSVRNQSTFELEAVNNLQPLSPEKPMEEKIEVHESESDVQVSVENNDDMTCLTVSENPNLYSVDILGNTTNEATHIRSTVTVEEDDTLFVDSIKTQENRLVEFNKVNETDNSSSTKCKYESDKDIDSKETDKQIFQNSKGQSLLDDEYVANSISSCAKTLSRIEAKEKAKSYSTIKDAGISLAKLTTRLPFIAAEEVLKSSGSHLTNSTASLSYTKQTLTSIERDDSDLFKQKTLEPEIVIPPQFKSEHLPSMLRNSWMSYKMDEDCLFVEKRRKMCRILIRGNFLSQRISTIAQATFCKALHESLSRMRYREPMRIQTYSWPALMRGHDLVMVNPPNSGKTLGYLVPIMSFMLSPDLYAELPEGNGPLVLILCPSWVNVKQNNVFCKCLLDGVESSVTVVPTYGGVEMNQTISLINGCHVLISTPRCFLRLLRKDRFTTNLDRLCHLIFDEADTLMELFLPEVREILKECRLLHQRRARIAAESSPSGGAESYAMVRIIAAAKKWCPQMEAFVTKVVEKPLLCIGSYLEAAVYACLKPKLHLVGFHISKDGNETDLMSVSSEKIITEIDDVVLRIIGERVGLYKIAVACESVVDIERLASKMKFDCDLLIIHENMHHTERANALHDWKCMQKTGACPILIISDSVLAEVDIGDAQHLVHVGIPSSSKTQFGLRFSTLMDNYRDIFAKKLDSNGEKDESRSCFVDIIVDLTKPNVNISGLTEFLQRLGMDIPPELDALASIDFPWEEEYKSFMNKESVKKRDILLCRNLKSFGVCSAMSSCKFRHIILPDVDKPAEDIPSSGKIRVKILHAEDPSNISVRLLEHIGDDGKNTEYSDDYYFVASDLARYYGNKQNRFSHGEPEIGDLCAIEIDKNLFVRVRVEELFYSDSNSWRAVGVTVYLIDKGERLRDKKYNLLYLPEHLKKYPAQSKELVVCRLAPRDLDTSWSEAARIKVLQMANEGSSGERDGKFVIGTIILALGNTIWVDPLECQEWLENEKTNVIHFSVHRDFIRDGMAVNNPDHIERLKTLCENGGLQLPSYPSENELDDNRMLTSMESYVIINRTTEIVTQSDIENHTLLADWEILDSDQLVEVNVINVESPHYFWVQKVAASEKISILYGEIQSWVENVWKNSSFKNVKEFSIGSFCLGYFESEGCWNRAKVINVMKPNGNQQKEISLDNVEEETVMYELYFVDYGDKVILPSSKVTPIPENFITQLPFQAVECALVGIRPVNTEEPEKTVSEEWNDLASDEFYKLCRSDDLIDYQPVLAKVFGTERIGLYGGSKYLVALYEKETTPKLRSIGKILVERGLAKPSQSIPDCEAGNGVDDLVNELDSSWNYKTDTALIQVDFESERQDVHSADDSSHALVPVEGDWSYISDNGLSQQSEDDSNSFDIVMSDDELNEMEKRCRDMLNLYACFSEGKDEVSSQKALIGTSADGEDFASFRTIEELSEDSIEVISPKSDISCPKFEELETIVEEKEKIYEIENKGNYEVTDTSISIEKVDEKENLHCLLENNKEEQRGISMEMSNLQIPAGDEDLEEGNFELLAVDVERCPSKKREIDESICLRVPSSNSEVSLMNTEDAYLNESVDILTNDAKEKEYLRTEIKGKMSTTDRDSHDLQVNPLDFKQKSSELQEDFEEEQLPSEDTIILSRTENIGHHKLVENVNTDTVDHASLKITSKIAEENQMVNSDLLSENVQKEIFDDKISQSENELTKQGNVETEPNIIKAKTPTVKWAQTKKDIIVKILLPNMNRYKVCWESNRKLLIFAVSDVVGESPHMQELELWGYVDVNNSVIIPISHNTLKVTMPKAHAYMEWPRLLNDPARPQWLSVDFDLMEFDAEEVNEEVPKKFVRYDDSEEEILSDDELEDQDNGERCEEVNYDPYDPLS